MLTILPKEVGKYTIKFIITDDDPYEPLSNTYELKIIVYAD